MKYVYIAVIISGLSEGLWHEDSTVSMNGNNIKSTTNDKFIRFYLFSLFYMFCQIRLTETKNKHIYCLTLSVPVIWNGYLMPGDPPYVFNEGAPCNNYCLHSGRYVH